MIFDGWNIDNSIRGKLRAAAVASRDAFLESIAGTCLWTVSFVR